MSDAVSFGVAPDPDSDESESEEFDFDKHAALAKDAYEQVYSLYDEFSSVIESIISTCLANSEISIHSITSRPKSIDGFQRKAGKASSENPNSPRYGKPLQEITDLAGVRVITYFLSVVQDVEAVIQEQFEVLERIDKSEAFEKDRRLGYQSLHFLVRLKSNRCALPEYARFSGLSAEIQVRTILQHTWAEIEHDIQYKAVYALPSQIRRRFMALAGVLEIADREFQAIAKQDRRLREAALKSVADDQLTGVEITPDALKAYLDKEFGPDGRMSDYSYSWTVGLLKDLGFIDLDELDEFLSEYNDGEVSRALHGARQGQLTRLEDVLMVAAGNEYKLRHPWHRPDNEWFDEMVDRRLEKAEGKGYEVGVKRLPDRGRNASAS
ncbi:GTP pyrophosphokinase family protein [Streptomyces sp. NPDC056634]|uniref:GTP pyrophosphokinase n=1 Tax=Streptomyces sp. NPDC056634 TaxID=3345885 RepID=UPI00369664B8